MPNIVKDKFNSLVQFRDIGFYLREFGKCIYKGYVPHEFVTGIPSEYKLSRYAHYSDYWWKDGMTTRRSLNLPYSITKYILDNMYSEQPQIEFGNDEDFMNKVLESNDFYRREKKLQGSKLNIGDYVLKPYVDGTEIKIDYMKGTMFIATKIENNRCVEGVFVSTKQVMEKNKKITYRRLEWHLKEDDITRKVVYEIYRSKEPNKLGSICNLSVAETIFGEQIENGEELYEDLKVPTFILGINANDNNFEDDSGRGLGMFMNSLHTIQSADESYEAKQTDIVYGSMQKLVPEQALEMNGVPDDEGFTTYKHHNPKQPDIFVYGGSDMQDAKPEAYAPQLRTEQQIMSINTDIDITSVNIGITAGTFRFDGKSIITATQVISEKSDTARTIKEIERNTGEDWKDLFMLIKYFANKYLSESITFERDELKINWKDSIIVDDETKKDNLKYMAEKGWIPPYKYTAQEMGIEEKEAMKLYDEAQALEKEKFGFNLEEPIDDDNIEE